MSWLTQQLWQGWGSEPGLRTFKPTVSLMFAWDLLFAAGGVAGRGRPPCLSSKEQAEKGSLRVRLLSGFVALINLDSASVKKAVLCPWRRKLGAGPLPCRPPECLNGRGLADRLSGGLSDQWIEQLQGRWSTDSPNRQVS